MAGLAYVDMHPPSDHELDMLPHFLFTSDAEWIPSDFDNEPDNSLFHDALPFPDNYVVDDPMLDDLGDFHDRVIAHTHNEHCSRTRSSVIIKPTKSC